MPQGKYIRSKEHGRKIGLALKGRRIIIPPLDLSRVPDIGEIRRIRGTDDRLRWKIWWACPDCGKERWVEAHNIKNGGKPIRVRCPICSGKRATGHQIGENNPAWKGGRHKNIHGYIAVNTYPDDFFYPMRQSQRTTHHGYILEHRLVMAKHLNRRLLSWEVVHHRNGIKDDNRIENLELLPTNKQHQLSIRIQQELAKRDKRIEQLEARITLLEAENILLKAQSIV